MTRNIRTLPQLNSIRALSAFCIIIYHYLMEFNFFEIRYGWIGVDVFFVISGFLITSILLSQKARVSNKLLIIKNFIAKRTLRLFPAYYFFILLVLSVLYFFFGIKPWSNGNAIYFFTYTQNMLIFREGLQGIQVNHTWSLAVEEQFYLIWPWLLLFLPNKLLIRILLLVILVIMVLKGFVFEPNTKFLTVSHFDTLGAGAVIALLMNENILKPIHWINKYKTLLVIGSLIILCWGSFFKMHEMLVEISVMMISVALVMGCYFGFTGNFGKFLNHSGLQYLGIISYGLYLYHKPIPSIFKMIIERNGMVIDHTILLIIALGLTFLLAHFSYQLIEKPFLKMKTRFNL
ncbi:MAG: acyltransferase family protein [Chitinophagales bacterium]